MAHVGVGVILVVAVPVALVVGVECSEVEVRVGVEQFAVEVVVLLEVAFEDGAVEVALPCGSLALGVVVALVDRAVWEHDGRERGYGV